MNSVRISISSLVLLIVMLFPGAVCAQKQDTSKTRSYSWITFASFLGPVTPYDVGMGISYNWGRKTLYQVRLDFVVDLFTNDEIRSTNIYWGRGRLRRYVRVALFTGLSFNFGNDYDIALGLSGNIQLMFMPLRELGFGIDLYSTANPKETVAAARISLIIGYKLRG